MNYSMRRKDREETREFALAVIDKAPFGVMASADADGQPYCIPLSLARDGDTLYFHCAVEGHKLDNLRRDNRVCVSFTGELFFPEDDFSVAYESALVFGAACELTEDEEKIRGLRIISQRWTPANMHAFDKAIEQSLKATSVWKITMESVSGKKRKRPGS